MIRWDNSPHYPYLKTFPHHKHYKEKVLESKEIFLEQVLKFIEVDEMFGIWKDRDITKEKLRDVAWGD